MAETSANDDLNELAKKSPPSRLLRRHAVEELTGLSRSGIYDLMARGIFPKPVSLGPQSVAWLETEIWQWIAERIAARDQAA
jgi:prophage regulatory protein